VSAVETRATPFRGARLFTPWGPGRFDGITGSQYVVELDEPIEIDGRPVTRIGVSPEDVSR
jgi:hypothetical protein